MNLVHLDPKGRKCCQNRTIVTQSRIEVNLGFPHVCIHL